MQTQTISAVLAAPAADPEDAFRHFSAKLAYETDPSDVNQDMQAGEVDFVLLDVRNPKLYAKKHAAGAVSLHHMLITEDYMRDWDRDVTYITYCSGPGCNGSTKAAMKLSALGFKVKEMIGGFEYWDEIEGLPTETEA